EEEKEAGQKTVTAREGASKKSLRYRVTDVTIGMVFSCLVMYFIIFTTAATLFKAGKTDIKSATDAAEALRPLAGNGARNLLGINPISALFWAAGIHGFVAPPLLVIIMLAGNQKKIMGKCVNGLVTNIIGWATAVVMAAAAIALVLTWGKA